MYEKKMIVSEYEMKCFEWAGEILSLKIGMTNTFEVFLFKKEELNDSEKIEILKEKFLEYEKKNNEVKSPIERKLFSINDLKD